MLGVLENLSCWFQETSCWNCRPFDVCGKLDATSSNDDEYYPRKCASRSVRTSNTTVKIYDEEEEDEGCHMNISHDFRFTNLCSSPLPTTIFQPQNKHRSNCHTSAAIEPHLYDAVQKGMFQAQQTNTEAQQEDTTCHNYNNSNSNINIHSTAMPHNSTITKSTTNTVSDNDAVFTSEDDSLQDTSAFPCTEFTIDYTTSTATFVKSISTNTPHEQGTNNQGDDDDEVVIRPTVSELTMHSHGDAYLKYLTAKNIHVQRRMAYYAVGDPNPTKTLNQNNPNRRCYFTGREILPKQPFFAGVVNHDLRSLVVFCLPSSLDYDSSSSYPECLTNISEETLIHDIQNRYPQQFATLPIQMQTPSSSSNNNESCWKLYVKFCFFSGLPIAEGEMHYRVQDSQNIVKTSNNDKEDDDPSIYLSHELIVSINGEQSADIIRLPNKKTFAYLKTHYQQQSTKLKEQVFL